MKSRYIKSASIEEAVSKCATCVVQLLVRSVSKVY